MSLVLYRKYRPQSFQRIIGQEHIVQTLTNSILNNSIAHAYLFCGPRGSGKTTIARLFGKAINCPNREKFEPCNKCPSCLEFSAGRAMDLIEIDAASHRGVEDIRELREGARFVPVSAKYKVFIIDECHQLSKDATNALLKTLEEPPSHVIFILATTEMHKMIPTIISRCQRHDFKRLQVSDIVKKLEYIVDQEGIKIEKPALSVIALNARGSFRDAESLLDECHSFSGKTALIKAKDVESLLGIIEVGQIAKFVDLLLSKNTKEALLFINALMDGGVDLQEFAKDLVYYLRQAMISKISPELLKPETTGFGQEEILKLKSQSESFSEKGVVQMIEIFIDAENKLKYSSLPQLPLELAVLDSILGSFPPKEE
ncbi:DNA polymerase III subunit gamma/tau [Patescibacteria group bacterium]|nr:DNA polymerase III subunit gamma/tau [Patescibacteria group bacterium]